jgi:hypothetical protein
MRAIILHSQDAEYTEMAQECARRLKKYAGIRKRSFIETGSKNDAHFKKIECLLEFREPVVLVDADWWLVQACAIPEPSGTVVIAAPCHGVDHFYKGTCVPPLASFCSCLVALDMSNEAIREVIKDAMERQRRASAKEALIDEWFLNTALYDRPSVTVCCLSSSWNWCAQNYHERVVAVHAAGRTNKLNWLKNACLD